MTKTWRTRKRLYLLTKEFGTINLRPPTGSMTVSPMHFVSETSESGETFADGCTPGLTALKDGFWWLS